MNHIKRINEMFSQHPTASEVYDIISNSPKASFVIKITRDDNDGINTGVIMFAKLRDKIVELTYDKKTDEIYNVIMYNDTTNARKKFSQTIVNINTETIENIETKSSDEIAEEILNYLLGTPQR